MDKREEEKSRKANNLDVFNPWMLSSRNTSLTSFNLITYSSNLGMKYESRLFGAFNGYSLAFLILRSSVYPIIFSCTEKTILLKDLKF